MPCPTEIMHLEIIKPYKNLNVWFCNIAYTFYFFTDDIIERQIEEGMISADLRDKISFVLLRKHRHQTKKPIHRSLADIGKSSSSNSQYTVAVGNCYLYLPNYIQIDSFWCQLSDILWWLLFVISHVQKWITCWHDKHIISVPFLYDSINNNLPLHAAQCMPEKSQSRLVIGPFCSYIWLIVMHSFDFVNTRLCYGEKNKPICSFTWMYQCLMR